MSKAILMDKVSLPQGLVSLVRGQGNIVTSQHATMWLENGLLWVLPKRGTTANELRCYHPASCEMYPAPGQDLPSPPAAQAPLKVAK